VVPGIHSVSEVFKIRPRAIEELWLREGALHGELEEFHRQAQSFRVKIKRVAQKTLDREVMSHQGVIAFVKEGPLWPLAHELRGLERALILALDGLEDPHNVGSLMRTCWGMGAVGVIVPNSHTAALAPSAQKVASGAFEHVPILETANLGAELKDMKDLGFWIYGLDGSSEKSIWDVELAKKSVLVIGSEESGLRKPVASSCDELVRIPQSQTFESFNAAVAGAMACYEFSRQIRQ
jgi:23S rRNA (guanosine2251-2'-O)-methyltransferase